jgi:drug/metabolite transporter (DMT)-like permease
LAESNHHQPMTLSSACLATLCAMFWGGLAVAIRYTQDDLPPMATAGLRFGLATLIMAAWARSDGVPIAMPRDQWLPVSLSGLLLYLQIGSFHWGLTETNSAHASILIGSNPVIVALLAHFGLQGDRLSWTKSAGLLLATCGMITVIAGDSLWGFAADPRPTAAPRDPATLFGDLVVLASSILLGTATVYNKHVLQRVPAGRLLFWSYLLATAAFLATSLAIEPLAEATLDAASFWGLIYQSVIVAGFCFATWTALLRRHRASQLAVFGFGQPLFGMLFGNLFRGDPLTLWLAAGGAAIALGILLVTREGPGEPVEEACLE